MKFSDYGEAEKKYGVGGGGDWFNLVVGDNEVRLVSEFEDYGVHYDPGLKKYFTCIGKDQCPYCKKDAEDVKAGKKGDERPYKINVRYLGWVIDRKAQKAGEPYVKLFVMPYMVFRDIGKYSKNKQYEFDKLPNYDITINRTGEGKKTRYSVLPFRSDSKLTKEEQAEIERVAQNEPAGVIENMKDKALAMFGGQGDEPTQPAPAPGLEKDEEIDPEKIPF